MQDYSVELYNKICEVTNENPLPISIKYFIIKDIFKEVELNYQQYLIMLENENQNKEKEQEGEMYKTIDIPVNIPLNQSTEEE